DTVEQDETVLEIATDKVDSEVPAPIAGVLVEILVPEGETVDVGTAIAIIDTDAAAGTGSTSDSSSASKSEPEPATEQETEPAAEPEPEPAPAAEEPKSEPKKETSSSSDRFYSPLVKSIAREEGISASELDTIEGTGAQGRVNKEDLMNYISA